MKKAILIVAGLGLILSGCAKGVDIGTDCKKNDKRPQCLASTSLPTSPTPTPTKTKKTGPKASPTPTKTEDPGYEGKVYNIRIQGGQQYFYEWKAPGQKSWTPGDTGGPRLYVGDIILFKNGDDRFQHSFTSYAGGKFTKEFDSGFVQPGKTWRWVVDADPGRYEYRDKQVNYIYGGPLEVLPTPS